jgi:hypothetical protein
LERAPGGAILKRAVLHDSFLKIRPRLGTRARLFAALLAACLALSSGCRRFQSREHEYVYVVAKEVYLRDRVAAVSNRVAAVNNGQRLEVLEHNRRFLRVRTEGNQQGWLEEHSVIDQAAYDRFLALGREHRQDPVVATAVLRDDLYLHVAPGRKEDRYYLLPEGDRLELLRRASVEKPQQPGFNLPRPVASGRASARAAGKGPAGAAPASPPMEDWWLVRDSRGRVGWLLARRLDIEVPNEIAGYSEGQRMIGAYRLTTVTDPQAEAPGRQVGEYVAVYNSYQEGLPYDYDQIRVFTWNPRRHRYETAYRQRWVRGYLPVVVSEQTFEKGVRNAVFTVTLATDAEVALDPATGAFRPAHTMQAAFRLNGSIVARTALAGQPVQPLALFEPDGQKRVPRERGRR